MALEAGNYLSDRLITYIKTWTVVGDFKKVALENDNSIELIRGLLRKERKITESNKKIIYDVLSIAIKNRESMKDPLRKAHELALEEIKTKN